MTAPLRVLIVGPYPVDNAPVGGVETAVSGLAAGLAGLEDVHHVHVADLRRDALPVDEAVLDKLTVHRLPAQKRLRLLNGAADDVRGLRQLCRRIKPDIVHGQGVGLGGLTATRLGVPCVLTVHGIVSAEVRALGGNMLAMRARVMLTDHGVREAVSGADAVISISEYDRTEILRYGTPKRHAVIPNAVRPLCQIGSEPVNPVVLYAGVLIPRKDVVGVVCAFQRVRERLPESALVIAGPSSDPAYRESVQEAIDVAPGGIEFVGALDREGLGRALTAAGILVLFSKQETLPCIIAEAMLCGRPVVSSRVGGVPEMVVDGETGLLVDDGDVESLSDALARLLDNAELRTRMGAAARERGERLYDSRSVARSTLRVYREVLGAGELCGD